MERGDRWAVTGPPWDHLSEAHAFWTHSSCCFPRPCSGTSSADPAHPLPRSPRVLMELLSLPIHSHHQARKEKGAPVWSQAHPSRAPACQRSPPRPPLDGGALLRLDPLVPGHKDPTRPQRPPQGELTGTPAVPLEDACPCGTALGRRDRKAESPWCITRTGVQVTPTSTCWSPDQVLFQSRAGRHGDTAPRRGLWFSACIESFGAAGTVTPPTRGTHSGAPLLIFAGKWAP